MDVKDNHSTDPFEFAGNWEILAGQLKVKFSQLTHADLSFENGNESEMLSRVGDRLKMNRAEVIHMVKNIPQESPDIKKESPDIEKAETFIIVEIIEYVPNSVVIKTIIKKTTGNVTAVSFDSGETLTEKISPFDTFIQIIDGSAEIFIDDVSNLLATGQSIIIPAHARNTIQANVRFKMISTIIKSGYED